MDPFLGEIRIVSQSFAPKGWALCDGQLLNINQNQALWSLLGKTYGGDGITTFGLPDLRGKVVIGPSNAYALGDTGGQAANTITVAQMPAHIHTLNVSDAVGNKPSPANNYFADSGAGDNEYGNTMNTTMGTSVIATAGGGAPTPNMQPYLVVSFMIALQGIWPPRP